MGVLHWVLICSFILSSFASEPGVHLPLQRKVVPRRVRQRDVRRRVGRRDGTGVAGLGDTFDLIYTVLVDIGNVSIPVQLDTGSSDLWSITDACTHCPPDLPRYPQSRFQSNGTPIPITLQYGDSFTGTHADGEIGTDSVSLAGLSISTQSFAAVTDSNATILKDGGSGIFGLGFPVNSFIWHDTFQASQNTGSGLTARSESNNHRKGFPNLADLYPSKQFKGLNSRQFTSDEEVTDQILASWSTSGPLVNRLFLSGVISTPMFAVTLQRDTLDIGGNLGELSIGSLPGSVQNSSMTWVPIRLYPESFTSLAPPADSPDETYPVTWEVFIDGVFLDGEKLPDSTLASPLIADSALVDTGNSLIRGPSDVLNTIYQKIGANSQGVFPCSTPHTLAFQIGGQMFPVDPRDFASQALENDTSHCASNLAVTDTPTLSGAGFLNTWSLGDPFLKSVVSAYYFGNLTHPSQDPPRVGFLSTVPSDANAQYTAAIQTAQPGGNLAFTSEPAPSGLPSVTATSSNGVALATQTSPQSSGSNGSDGNGNNSGGKSGSYTFSAPGISILVGVVLGGVILSTQLHL